MSRRKKLLILFAAVGVAGGIGWWFGKDHILPESSPFTRGQALARSAGCLACHGLEQGGAPNPTPTEHGNVLPALAASRASAEVLGQWIAAGISDARAASEADAARRAEELVRMPAYADVLDAEEQADLVAYLLLLREHSEGEEWAEAEQLARAHACFDCHGPFGQGGVENPGSLKGYIPGFFGTDFDLLTRDGNETDVLEWIRDGAAAAFLAQGIGPIEPAVWFTDAQTVKMPAFGEFLDEEELALLTDYVLHLRSLGPLDAAAIEARFAPPAPVVAPEEELDFVSQVLPILRDACLDCHRAGKARSDYRIDTRERTFAGGSLSAAHGDQAIVPGEPESSRWVWMIKATEDDYVRDVYPMPPDEPLRDEEIAILERWIAEGAVWPEGVKVRFE